MDANKTGQSYIPAEIIFKPTCSSCEKQLNLVINYEEEIEEFTESKPNLSHRNYTITPSHCPFCGKRFENIIIPTSLPYDNRIVKTYNNKPYYKPQCNHCKYYKGKFDAKGYAGCSARKTIAVVWDDWCPEYEMQNVLATED